MPHALPLGLTVAKMSSAKTLVREALTPHVCAVIAKAEPPRAGTLSPAGPHDNNKDQFDFCSKMKK